jgi:hypothetical protein
VVSEPQETAPVAHSCGIQQLLVALAVAICGSDLLEIASKVFVISCSADTE